MPATCNTKLAPTLGGQDIPEYIWGAPTRTSFLEDGAEGQRLLITGRVITTDCRPIANAKMDFWHTDSQGEYDMAGYKFRGGQNTSEDGHFQLETVMPGYYSTQRHIHYLVGVRHDLSRPSILLTEAVPIPHDDEIRKIPENMGRAGSSAPASIRKENGVLVIPYDIVIEIG